MGEVLLSPVKMPSKKLPACSVKDVNQQHFTKAFAAFLKKSGKVKVPEWADLVKTASFKELAPFDEDWFYTRLSAIARHIYMRSPVGVGAVKRIFGGRINRGSAPSHYCRSSGSIARKALQTLEVLKLVEKAANGGRRLTSQGHRDLDRIASQIRVKSRSKKSGKPKAGGLTKGKAKKGKKTAASVVAAK